MSMRSKLARPNRVRATMASTAIVGLALITGCSTDVQRFGYTGSLPAANNGSAQSISRENVQTGFLAPPPPATSASITPPATSRSIAPPTRTSSFASTSGGIRVRSGDTMYSLARQNGVSVEELASANGTRFPYAINVGQTLRMPGKARASTARPASSGASFARATAHTVAPGDTLYSISRRYNVKVSELAGVNKIAEGGTIKTGQSLRIPRPGEQAALGGPLIRSSSRPAPISSEEKPRKTAAKTSAPAPVRTAKARESIGPLPTPPDRISSRFRWPARGRVVANFGIGQNGKRNDGINILVPAGTSVKSAENGVVAYVGDEIKGYGNLVLVRHSNDWVTAYAHNSQILVNRGDTVQRGQIIAKAGKTGSVSKPQVHFEVRKGAKAVNPMNYLEET